MTIDILKDFFMWSAIINVAILMISFVLFWTASDWIYKMHTRWFKISRQQFDMLWYGMLGFYKISTFLFNIVPFIALVIAQ